MAASEHAKPISLREDAMSIVHRLVHANHVAYFAGGCVRDVLLGLEPKDFDVVTSATPDQVRKLFPRAQGVGQAFGVLLIREGRSIIELATFRSDGDYTDGRRPDSVVFASPEEDARRRDFTINGLFFDPLTERVIDFVDGEADLQSKTLRAIGDPAHRFAEDYLRMLRAVRFAARFDLTIEPATHAAIREHAYKLPRIAPERICDELRAMLLPASRGRAKTLLDDLGLTDVAFRLVLPTPDPVRATSIDLFGPVCGDASIRPSFSLVLATLALELLLTRGVPIAELLAPSACRALEHSLRQTFRLSNDETAGIDGAIGVAGLLAADPPQVSKMKRFLAGPFSGDSRRLLRGFATLGLIVERVAWLEAQFASFPPAEVAPTPLLTGTDLQLAGHTPGPAFKTALDAAYDAQLEGHAQTRAEALDIAVAVILGRV